MDNKQISLEWFEMAEYDLKTALFLLDMKPIPTEIICYHCQQSAEKYLKGFIALNGEEILKTHDLTTLNKKCCSYDKEFNALEEACINLTDYGVQVRYPFHVDIEEMDMKLAIENAKKIKEFTLKKSEKL